MANPSKRFIFSLSRLHLLGSTANSRSTRSIFGPISSPKLNPIRSFSSEFYSSSKNSSHGTPSNPSSLVGVWRKGFLTRSTSPGGLLSSRISPQYKPSNPYARVFGCNCSSGVLSFRVLKGNRLISGIPSLPPRIPSGLGGGGLRSRFFSSGKFSSGKLGMKSVASKPFSALTSVVSRYREAVGLQVEAFWKKNYLALVGAVAVVVCILLWRIMFGIANTFVGLSEGMAKYGFLAMASAMVAFAGLYLRSRFTINPDKLYRMALRMLNTNAGILEIMGAPLTGTDVRAYVMSGGGSRLKNFKLKLGGKRCFLIFPIRGSERKGLVSIEAKKKKGQYDIKLLAVDVPMAIGPDQRIFLIGDEEEYKVGGGLISELRDPIVKAMAAEKEFEVLDEKEEEEDAERELEEEKRKREDERKQLEEKTKKQEEIEKRNKDC